MSELMPVLEKKKKIVEFFLEKKILINRDVLKKLEKEEDLNSMYEQFINPPKTKKGNYTVNIVKNNECALKKYTFQDFVSYFNVRYKALESMLKGRQELQNLTSIARIQQKKEREQVSLIGIVQNTQKTKNGNIALTLEDQTGVIKCIVSKSSPCFNEAKDLVFDEVVGVNGFSGDNVVFISSIIYPDIPLTQEVKKSPDLAYAAVISDVHLGSKYFLEEEFANCIEWLRGSFGTEEQREISNKIGYIFIVGDLVDGVGIYPGQENELIVKDIYEQYSEFIKYVKKIPDDKQIIISAGNHDALRLSEPQPKIPEEYCKELYKMQNVHFVTNPSVVNIHSFEGFPGFNFLLYHGYSYDHYGDVVESIRSCGKPLSDRVDLIMKFLLQRRHLAPTHSSTLYIPDHSKDSLVIDKVPDFFLSGHIHKSCTGNYRGVITISGSCFQAQTGFQEKVGHTPVPCIIPIINLQTRKISFMDFGKK